LATASGGVKLRHHDAAAGGQRLLENRAARESRQRARERLRDAHRELAAVGHQQRLRLSVVLGLRQQVRGHEVRARALIGDHQHLRWTGG